MAGRWLSILGIGEDGRDGLSPAARALLDAARLVAGGRRHLDLAAPLAAETLAWPSPLDAAIPAILARRGEPVVVLASGDPFCYGVGTTLARHVPPDEILSIPAPSAFSLAANRLAWPLPDTVTLALNGRAIERIVPHLHPGTRILALSADGTTPAAVAALLAARGFGRSRLTVLEAMGGPRERRRSAPAAGFDLTAIDPLNLMAIEVAAGRGARIVPRGAGLPDTLFEHDGQLTKREIRAVTLSSLAPHRGEHLWDIGLGAGSVAIEWLLADPANRATGIELRSDRAARAARNALALGVPQLRIVEGEAPAALSGLAPPDAVFIGGGGGEPGVVDAAWSALRPGGRIVVNAVTLETEALLLARHAELGGALTRIAIERAEPVGGLTAWRPAMPVVQWVAIKP